MPYNATADLWYQYFMQDGPQQWLLLGAYGIRMVVTTLGVLFNVSVVYVTVKNKSLHGTCNILIATESFFAIFQDSSFYISFFVVLSGVRFIQYSSCFPVLLPLAICGNNAQMTMVLTGIDRLLAILFPVWYKQRKGHFFLAFCFAVLLCYSAYYSTLYLIAFQYAWDIMTSCSTEDLSLGAFGALIRIGGLVLSGMTMGIYALVWLMVFKLKATSKNLNSATKKLVKALVFIIGFNLVGVFLRISIQLVFNYVPVTVFITKSSNIILSHLVIAVYSSNAPILYVNSNEYRTIFNKHFPWLKKLFKEKKPTTQTITVATTTNVDCIRNNHITITNATATVRS